LDVLILQDKHNIRTLSLNIESIWTRCETVREDCQMLTFLSVSETISEINFIFSDNVRILYIY
jgi:hypothetical protein